MAIEFFSVNCGDPMSPRISFSYDFCHSNAIPVEHHQYGSNSSGLNNPSFDFDFCVRENFDQESSSADELFSDGILLPSEIKKNKKNFPQKQIDHQFLLPSKHHKSLGTEAVRENASSITTPVSNPPEGLKEDEKQGHNHKSFWGFKKSKSYGTGYGRSLCPLPILSRSFSTGSPTSPSTSSSVKKDMSVSKEGKTYNNNSQKLHASARSSPSSKGHNSYLKPPLRKYQSSFHGNGVPVILNVPSANLFGFGSIFSRSKDKAKRKY